MIGTLAVEATIPTSVLKAILVVGVLLAWAKWATIVDKDAVFYHLNRRLWNGVSMAAAVIAFAAILFIPLFTIGFILGLAILAGSAFAYANTHNQKAPADKQWRLDAESLRTMLAKRTEERALRDASLRIKSAKGAPPDLKPVPPRDDSRYEAHLLLEEVLEPALRKGAQRIHFAGSNSQFQSQLVIDGVEYRGTALSPAPALAMLDYLKAHCGMDVSERRKRQTGRCRIESAELGEHELRVSSAGSTRGVGAKVLIDPVKQVTIPYASLGLLDSQAKRVEEIVQDGSGGVVLVATPPGEGRTTTLYAVMQQHDPYTMDLHAMEPAIEADLEGITQQEVDPSELTRRFESLMLRDPQVVMVSEVTDAELAQSVTRAAAEGKRIYAGLRADDGLSAVKKWLKAVGETELAAKGLRGAVSQRLLRRLCEYCRQRYKPDIEILRKMNLPADRIHSLYKSSGRVMVKDTPEPCPVCHGLGFKGRIAAFEVLSFDEQAKGLIRSGQLADLRTHLRRQKTTFLQEAVLAKVVSGETSISEVTRALGQGQAQAQPGREQPAA